MVQIVHTSDLHLFAPRTASGHLQTLCAQISPLGQLCSFAFPQLQTALSDSLKRAAAGIPSVLAVTGDIAAWPYDNAKTIDSVYGAYVESLFSSFATSSLLLAMLGNHEWTVDNRTHFAGTQFDTQHDLLANPRVRLFRHNGLDVIFFLADTTRSIVPATGEVQQATIDFLRDRFDKGKNDRLRFAKGFTLSAAEYGNAVKILMLHHHMLPYTAYSGSRLSWVANRSLRLRNRQDLLHACHADIDVFLFGHTHVPERTTEYGFVMIDTGSTLASSTSVAPPDAQFQVLQILDRDTILVLPYVWTDSATDFLVKTAVQFERRSGRWIRL